jgi:hypothetical protein
MEPDRRAIEKRIAELRELMRCTLDRSALPLMRESHRARSGGLRNRGSAPS